LLVSLLSLLVLLLLLVHPSIHTQRYGRRLRGGVSGFYLRPRLNTGGGAQADRQQHAVKTCAPGGIQQ